jgi:hypothetical protein
MEHYRKHYETLQDTEGSYIKRYDSGDRIHMHGIHGFVRTKISSFVMNIHTAPRTIYLVRSGETEHIRKGMIGGGLIPFHLSLSPHSTHSLLTRHTLSSLDTLSPHSTHSLTL